jgi:hypothetical protein
MQLHDTGESWYSADTPTKLSFAEETTKSENRIKLNQEIPVPWQRCLAPFART